MSPEEARALTDRIAATVDVALVDIETAWRERVDDTLGYESWGDYCRAEFQGLQLRPKDERPALLTSLAETGMSNVAIAEAVGVSEWTVRNQLRDSSKLPDTSTGKDGKQRPRRRKPIVDPKPMDDETAVIVADIIDRAPVTKWLAHGRQAVRDLHRIAEDIDSKHAPLLPDEQDKLRVLLDALEAAHKRWKEYLT